MQCICANCSITRLWCDCLTGGPTHPDSFWEMLSWCLALSSFGLNLCILLQFITCGMCIIYRYIWTPAWGLVCTAIKQNQQHSYYQEFPMLLQTWLRGIHDKWLPIMNHSIISQPVEPINLLVFLWPDCGQQDLPVTLVRNGATRRMDAHGQSVFNLTDPGICAANSCTMAFRTFLGTPMLGRSYRGRWIWDEMRWDDMR